MRVGRLPEGLAPAALEVAIEGELAAVNAAMSTYAPDSELSRFNAGGTEWFPVTPELLAVVDRAKAIHGASDGALDISIGPLVDAWGFGPAGTRGRTPSPEELAAARARTGLDQLERRDRPPALRKRIPGLQLDLSAIAKGHGVDRVALVLEGLGVTDYLVEVGGDLRTRGRRPDGNAWRIGIERPDPADRAVQRVVPMGGPRAMATSGDYRNFFETAGRRFAHLIDPRTGMPVQHDLASVSVLAEDCATADGWATALSILGPETGYRLATARGLAALFVIREAQGFREAATPAFEQWLGQAQAAGETARD